MAEYTEVIAKSREQAMDRMTEEARSLGANAVVGIRFEPKSGVVIVSAISAGHASSHPLRWWWGAWGGQGGYPRVERMRVSNLATELPLDTLLGPTYDGLDIITGAGEFEAKAGAFELWCLLLNHGYRLAGTGSSGSWRTAPAPP
jgi:hypothetical protein